MGIISRTCQSAPFTTNDCLAFFGVEYKFYLVMILISLITGFGSNFIYSKIRNIGSKKFVLKSFITSLIIFIILSVLFIWAKSQVIY